MFSSPWPAASRKRKAKKSSGARRPSIWWSDRRTTIVYPLCSRAPPVTARRSIPKFPFDGKFDHLAAPSAAATRARGVAAFVTVQEGCDKFCTFCVVPYTRGAEISRPVGKIADDVTRLADAGVREITLIGQNVPMPITAMARTGGPGPWRGCSNASPMRE